ncbi:MAG: hypothetical protein AB1716_15120 [Planctomycetota bacterium]
MRKWLIGVGVLVGLALVLLLAVRNAGPWAALPTVDPIVRWNAEHADLVDNAAELYEQAFARMVKPDEDLHKRLEDFPMWREPLPPEIVAWIRANEPALELARQATQRERCWFKLERDAGNPLAGGPHLADMRMLAKLFAWRAALAGESRDWAAMADYYVSVNKLGRHLTDSPFIGSALMGVACASWVESGILRPFCWAELSPVERVDYSGRLTPVFVEWPGFAAAMAGEQDLTVWLVSTLPYSAAHRVLAPRERIAGEIVRSMQPLHQFAAASVEQHCDPESPLLAQIEAMKVELTQASPFNLPRRLAGMIYGGYPQVLRLRARLVATQRGQRTVLELFAYHDRTGRFPASLAELAIGTSMAAPTSSPRATATGAAGPGARLAPVDAPPFTIDPYTGQPFCYRLTDGGFILYSAAADRDDDGGRHDTRFAEPPIGKTVIGLSGDYVFWPIQHAEDPSKSTATSTAAPESAPAEPPTGDGPQDGTSSDAEELPLSGP